MVTGSSVHEGGRLSGSDLASLKGQSSCKCSRRSFIGMEILLAAKVRTAAAMMEV